MTANQAIRSALVAQLKLRPEMTGVAGLSVEAGTNTLPQVRVDDPVATEWGTKDRRGRELRTAITIRVSRGQTMRLPMLVAAAESVGEALAGSIDGWRIGSAMTVRARSFDSADGTRSALVEHRIRVLED